MWDAWRRAGLLALTARQPMNLDLVWAALGLAGAILVGVIVIVGVDRWRKRQATSLPADNELDHFRALFDRGLLSAEEYERIRTHLGERNRPQPAEPAAGGPAFPGPSAPAPNVENPAPSSQEALPQQNPGNPDPPR